MKKIEVANAESIERENVYDIRRKKTSVLNVLILQAGLCLLLSLTYLAIQFFGNPGVVETVKEAMNIYL
ncbi:MAG: hypothetical protein ACI4S9_07695 [Christensenellales bacterium]